MLKPQTRCSRKLQEYLQDLARREDLELLRAPLREHDLFPPDKDGATAAITGEELKKLVRHWKLHEARGFWKMHPQKEDLVYALLEYMEDKEEYNRKGPTRPPSSKPTKEPPKVKARRQSQVDLATFRVSVLKFAGIALNNLSQECAYHDVLLRNSITNALQHLAESREDEVRRMCASTVRALTASDELRAADAADNLSALLTALFKRVDKPQTRSLCAAALIARQGDQEGAHYSDGSVVALFSAMQSEVSGYDAAAAASPTKMKTDKRQISPGVDDDDAHGHHDTLPYFFSNVDAGTCSPSTIRSRQVDRDKIVVEPMWMHFEQDSHVVSEGLEAPPTQSLKLPKQPADPPRTMYTKSSGRFRKIILFPNKVKAENDAHHAIKDDDATWGDHGSQFEIVTTFDFGQVYPPLAA